MSKRLTLAAARAAVAEAADGRYAVLLRHGTLELGSYAPPGTDPQQPHDRDELYVIQSGRGTFLLGSERHPFEPGEVLFVPAGVTHRFEDYRDDFAAWVVFYGPIGGESASGPG